MCSHLLMFSPEDLSLLLRQSETPTMNVSKAEVCTALIGQ